MRPCCKAGGHIPRRALSEQLHGLRSADPPSLRPSRPPCRLPPAGSWPNRLSVAWEFTDCSALVEGDMRVDPKDGVNAQWQAFYFSNAKWVT